MPTLQFSIPPNGHLKCLYTDKINNRYSEYCAQYSKAMKQGNVHPGLDRSFESTLKQQFLMKYKKSLAEFKITVALISKDSEQVFDGKNPLTFSVIHRKDAKKLQANHQTPPPTFKNLKEAYTFWQAAGTHKKFFIKTARMPQLLLDYNNEQYVIEFLNQLASTKKDKSIISKKVMTLFKILKQQDSSSIKNFALYQIAQYGLGQNAAVSLMTLNEIIDKYQGNSFLKKD